jgi:nitrous oxidase accessory protein
MRFAAGAVCWFAGSTSGGVSLQAMIDAAPVGAVLRPPPGRYLGGVVIAKPLTLDGRGKVTLDGGGKGTVLTVRSAGVKVRGLHVTNSGQRHDSLDAGVAVEADGVAVEGNRIDEVLFGVHLRQSRDSLIRGNTIRGHSAPLNLRGDGVRLWNSRGNRVEGNLIEDTRDITLANSPRNRIVGNTIRGGRYGMQLVFSPRIEIEANTLVHNATGIAVLYSDEVTVRGNRILHSRDVAGAGLAFKESSQVRVERNEVVHCAVGAQANSPVDPTNLIYFRGNRFAHNIAGMYFYGEKGGHIVHGNRFENNLTQVMVSGPTTARDHDWRGNYWDDYKGFDRDGDGVGDTPYEQYAYADRIWMDFPKARFFLNAPVLELIDFLERLAPFAAPDLILRDPVPRHLPVDARRG